MKKIIVLAICALCAMTAWGQTLINYTYDDAGNRIKREPSSLVQTRSMATTPFFEWAEPLGFQPFALAPSLVMYQSPKASRGVLDTSLAVGRIEGVSNVSPTGAATYQIPIKVPAGTGGIQPQISINYNSQAGNGLMGWGWNLSATSAITRIGKNFYYDGKAEDIKLNTTDNLVLDGKRLMLASGTNLTTGTYAPEVEDYSIAECAFINGYNAFRVRTRDGLTYDYGSTADSYIRAPNSSAALSWLLSKVTDRFGNSMTYQYDTNQTTGESYLSMIEYNYHGKSIYSRIEFLYNTRTDVIDEYVAGNVLSQKRLLTGINVMDNRSHIREYRFRYSFDGNYSKLNEVEEYGQDYARYNSAIVSWEENPGMYSKYSAEEMAYLSTPREGIYPDFQDFNGDGLSDMMTYPTKSAYSASDNAVLYAGVSMYGTSYNKRCTIPLIQGFVKLMYADLNGDGKMDVIRVHQVGTNSFRYEYYTFNGTTFTNTAGFNNSDYRAVSGDFNGDGKMEILTRDNKLYNGNAAVIVSGGITNWGTEYTYSNPNDNYIVDFNGDGQSDLLTMNATSSWVYTLSGSTFVQLTSFSNAGLKNTNLNYFGDFNGDGKTDVLCRTSSSAPTMMLYISNGRSFSAKQISNSSTDSKILVGDTNLDGRDEIIQMNPATGGTKLQVRVGSLNGSNVVNELYTSSSIDYKQINEDIANDRRNVAVTDLDGDGRVELILSAFAEMNLIYSFNDKLNLQVKRIQDGYNMLTDFQYESLPTSGAYTESTQTPSFPVVKMKLPMYVVTHQSKRINTYSRTLSYRYKDLYIHRQGKGMIGFGELSEVDSNKGKTVTSKMAYNSTSFIPYMSSQTVQVNGTQVYNSAYYYSFVSKGGKRYALNMTSVTENDGLRGTSTQQSFVYDAYGNVTTARKVAGDEVEVETTSYYNSYAGYYHLLGVPTSWKVVATKGRVSSYEKENVSTVMTASWQYGEMRTSTNNGNMVVRDSCIYDGAGNMIEKYTRQYSSNDKLSCSYMYSANGQYLLESTDAYGHKTKYVYNNEGLVTRKTNYKNQSTQYEYDDMGNLVKTIYPDGVIETTTLAWDSSAPQSLFAVTKTSTIAPTTRTYYNALGKVVREGVTRFDGTMTYTDTNYDQNGRLQRVSLPFTGTSATLWNTYTYDAYDRPTKVQYASGKMDMWSYSGTSVTETKEGLITTRTTDATGKLTKATDMNGAINYTYLPSGQTESIKLSSGLQTSFTYDTYGRQATMNDPSLGITTYGYDKYGNQSSRTDANGDTENTTYDKYGKLLTRTTPEGTFAYTYNADNLLVSITGTNGTGFAYTYDAFGNVLTEKETGLDGKWLQESYSYVNGRVTATTYQSNTEVIGTESYTYANGHLKTVTWGNEVIWDLLEVNAFGQPTKVKTGEVTRTYTYDAYGYPTGRTATSVAGGTFLNSAYGFDRSTGNLNSRTDVKRNLTEGFIIYNGNVLYNMCNVFDTTTVTQWDEKGNITVKSDAGEMDYDRYQVKTVDASYLEQTDFRSEVSTHEQDVTYTSFMRPKTIKENGYEAALFYNADDQRIKMEVKKDGAAHLTRHYLGNVYEVDETLGSVKEKLYLGGGYYDAFAVYVKQGGVWQMNYVCRDYLGSVTHITDAAGSLLAEYSYDAWGRLRNPVDQKVYAQDAEPELLLGRGYTGHEHLSFFGLINMNARLYDPILGLFLSPDPYVQLPDNTLNYNRYAYAMNNPLKYTDRSGEKWWSWLGLDLLTGGFFSATVFSNTAMTAGAIKGIVTGGNVEKAITQTFINEAKILGGLFTTDWRKDIWGQTWELISRFTWQLPQTTLGYGFGMFSNLAGQVDNVDYWGGATVMSGKNWNSGAVTLGSFIAGNENLVADPNNYLFQHEYGHYLQSKEMGWGYLSTVGVPSIISAGGDGEHSLTKSEQDANRRAFNYFNNNVPGFYSTPSEYVDQINRGVYNDNTSTGWNFYSNPLNINGSGIRGQYYDHYMQGDISVSHMTLNAKWYNHLAGWGMGAVAGFW